jgi:endonuclease/exonuclease/phosphatase family metal-dependent hydrolase
MNFVLYLCTMKKYLYLILFTLFTHVVIAGGPKKAVFAFYNVENLFDTIDDPHINDNEYLPTADKKWNSFKYKTKLSNLSKVIASIDEKNMPIVIGFCEVENKEVLQDLAATEKLKEAKYEVIHRHSPDARGIDVAAMYRKDKFKLIEYHYYPISYEEDGKNSKTREILHIKGVVFGKDTVHLFYNHWPSRIGGEEESKHKRKAAAEKVKQKTDSLFKINSNTKIIIMGDLNDHPTDENVEKVLGAANQNGTEEKKQLINLLYEEHLDKKGTHSYKNEWGVLDNIIVSAGILNTKKGARTKNELACIFKQDWLLYTNKNGEQSPSRSFSGDKFHENGYSDHLPVYITVMSK